MEKPLILIVEDDVDYANNLCAMVKSSGKYEAIAANSAKEAFEQLSKNKIFFGLGGNRVRLILLDIKMPEMDGLQFLEKIRKTYTEEQIGIIMVTAYEDEEKWERATSGFVAGYITKPFKEEKLLEALDRYFSGEKEKFKMVLDTFEKHIEKKGEFKKKEPETSA